MKNSLQFESLSVGYHSPLLKDLSIRLDSPCLAGMIGNNGKGKTTLLKTISGLLQPLAGKIIFNGRNISEITAHERARIIGLGFASNPITFPITVFELVSMGRYPYNDRWASLTKEDEKIISEAIELCGIAHLKNYFVNNLSDGERQKACIAKVLAQQTPVVLFDEPTAFLDYTSKKNFFLAMKKIAQEQNKIILISSHDIDFLSAYADAMIMIEDESVTFGTTGDLSKSDYFKTHFSK